ncbi:hypothetical protein [Collinsella aerofaciens]|uniref:hypothetical protein n=1 Tax=Collinsella aerofaciens TaxID=74426 RepID=UPI0011DD8206|nr:hypothetical protein [Collinsella aerofaciens]MDB1855131.1 hypothetical protein [Collinsella aerofaciens]
MESAIDRFREQLMDNRYEHSAYIDDAGYVHALGSTGKEGSTRVAPLSSVAHEKGVSTIIHNHPHGGSDGRKWGGPLSGGDLEYIASAYNMSGGRVKRIVATSNEGTYSALVTKSVSGKAVRSAVKRADATVRGRKYQSEIAMWRAVNKAYTSEFAKIGIEISYEKQPKKSGLLVTQKTGTYA